MRRSYRQPGHEPTNELVIGTLDETPFAVIVNKFHVEKKSFFQNYEWEQIVMPEGYLWPNPNRVQMTFERKDDAEMFKASLQHSGIFCFQNWH